VHREWGFCTASLERMKNTKVIDGAVNSVYDNPDGSLLR
jgi:hypothetical protein